MSGWRMSLPRSRSAAVVGAAAVAAAVVFLPSSPAAAFSVDGPGGVIAPPPASSIDRTVTNKARTSKTYREKIPLTEWVVADHAKYVAMRESGGSCKAVSPGGTYRGKWQMGAPFWSAYGGKAYASRPDLATCSQQDKVAYRGWIASWWHPWGGA